MKRKGMRKIVYVLCFLLLLQAVSFPVFADPVNRDGEIDGLVLSDNSNLSSLIVENGTLFPAFSADQTKYEIVGNGSMDSITAIGMADDATATVSIAGYGTISDHIGSNQVEIQAAPVEIIFTINVTAENGSIKTYHLTVYNDDGSRNIPPSGLMNLGVTSGQMMPAFNPTQILQPYYAAVVGSEVAQIQIFADVVNPMDGIFLYNPQMNQYMEIFFGISDPIPLVDGFNSIEIFVNDGIEYDIAGMMPPDSNAYHISVFRESAPPVALSNNDDLSALTFREGTRIGTLSPEFDAEILTYTATVASVTEGITVTATAADSKANVSVDGGTASKMIRLNEESATIIPILVTAEDGNDQTYTLTVTKEAPAPVIEKNNLRSLSVSGGTLYPAFSADQTEYLIVANPPLVPDPDSGRTGVSNLVRVVGVAETEGATVTVADIKGNMRSAMAEPNDTSIAGRLGIAFHPQADFLFFRFDVTSPDESRKSYRMKAVNEQPDPVTLSGLTTSLGTLAPVFNPETSNYAVTVAHETRAITVAGSASIATANVSVNGKSTSEVIALSQKETTIEIAVTAEYETDHKIYTLTITKAEPTPLSSNNDLRGLVVSEGSLSPDFDAEESNYVVTVARSVSSLTLTGTLADDKASMAVNGDSVTSGQVSMPIELLEESTTIPIVVRAEDGMVKTYMVNVIKEAKKSIGRIHHLVSERTFGGRTIARFDDLKFGLIVQRDESGLVDYRVPIRSKANDVRLLIPYADVMTKSTKEARDLVVSYQGHEIRIPMAVFEGDWLAGMPCETEATFEIHLVVDESGQTTYTIDFFVVEQINKKTRLVHRRTVQK